MIQAHYAYYALRFYYYPLHLRSSGIRSWGLGTPALEWEEQELREADQDQVVRSPVSQTSHWKEALKEG